MHKKYFIFTTLSVAILIFSILPIVNYIIDPSRILHHDYKYRYTKFHPNKLSLKILYLLENKTKYDTLVYGSSRGEFMDVSLISKNAYNMTHGFGTVSTYLNSLKTLLKHGVKVKNVWIAVNDYVIWKDQSDSLIKLIYQNNLFYDIPLYVKNLFTLNPKHIQILKDRTPLIETKEVTDPNERLITARLQEKTLWTPRNIPPATLGYTGKYRIDKATEEIRAIKQLCSDNQITLTVFMYPIYAKTYLRYDQYKIEEFKKKLVEVLDFHDFYALDTISINELKWFEGSHFVPSIGDYMIQSIQQKNALITKETVEQRIQETRNLLKNITYLRSERIYHMSMKIPLDKKRFKTIFDINNFKYTYQKNNDFQILKNKHSINVKVTNSDPYFILNQTKSKAKHAILSFSITSSQNTLFTIYVKPNSSDKYIEKYHLSVPIKKGLNEFRLVMAAKYINNELRVDFVKDVGSYTIHQFTIQEFN